MKLVKLCLVVFIDDSYHAYVHVSVNQRRNVEQANLSDFETITISICEELVITSAIKK